MLKWYSRIVACQVQHHRQRSGKQQQQRRWWQGTSWWQCCWTNVSSSSEDQRYVLWLYIVAFERYLVSQIGLGQIRVRPQEDDMKSHSSYRSFKPSAYPQATFNFSSQLMRGSYREDQSHTQIMVESSNSENCGFTISDTILLILKINSRMHSTNCKCSEMCP